jgi:hypothetical protein
MLRQLQMTLSNPAPPPVSLSDREKKWRQCGGRLLLLLHRCNLLVHWHAPPVALLFLSDPLLVGVCVCGFVCPCVYYREREATRGPTDGKASWFPTAARQSRTTRGGSKKVIH